MADTPPVQAPSEVPGSSVGLDRSADRTFMGGTKLRARLMIFVITGLVAIAATAGLLFVSDQQADEALKQVADAQEVRDLVTRIESGSLQIHGDGRNFLLERDMRYADNYQQRTTPVLATLDELFKHPRAQDVSRHVSTINDGIAQLAAQFTKIVGVQKIVGFSDTEGLANLVRASASALETRVAAAGNLGLVSDLSDLREIEAGLLAGTSKFTPAGVESRITNLKRKLGASTIAESAKGQLRELIDSYSKDIGQLASTRAALTKEIARLGEINAYMAPSLEALLTFSEDNVATALEFQRQTRQRVRQMLAGGTGGVIVVLVIVGLMMMRSITQPTTRLATAATRLAHGERNVSIPALGNYDETGELASALTYFRENIAQTDRLRKELEEHLSLASAAIIPEAETTAAEADAPPTQMADDVSPIAEISRMVTQTSQSASLAAHEAERTEIMVSGLKNAGEKIMDVDRLIAEIRDQTGMLAVQASVEEGGNNSEENLIVLPSKSRDGERDISSTMTVEERIEDIQNSTKQAMELVRGVGETINQVNNVAVDLAAETSSQALDAATELLRQSEDLRGILDNLLVKIRPDGSMGLQPRSPLDNRD